MTTPTPGQESNPLAGSPGPEANSEVPAGPALSPAGPAGSQNASQPAPEQASSAGCSPVDDPAAEAPRVPSTVRSGNIPDILNEPVTLYMRTAAPLLRGAQTIGESIDTIRACQDIGRVVYFYVVDDERRLQGVVSTRSLLLGSPQTVVADVMSRRTVAIPSTATVLEACEFFTLHKLLAFPVVDADHKVVGAVDVDLYTDELQQIDRRQDSDDLFQLIGVHLTEAAQKRPGAAFWGRFPWLLSNVLGGMLSAWIADAYQDVSTLAVVAPFIALVTALAESVSIQSVSLALQALHAQPPGWRVFAGKVRLELVIGFLLGGACGLIVAAVAWIWKGSLAVAASLLFGIVGGVVASAGIGLSMPFVLKICRRDPQVASGPIALALSDIVTLYCYFNLGRWILEA